LVMKPTTGVTGCCARATSGHAAAAPPSSVMNWRRLSSSMGSSPEPAVPAYRRLRMSRKHPHVLGGDLNCSESARAGDLAADHGAHIRMIADGFSCPFGADFSSRLNQPRPGMDGWRLCGEPIQRSRRSLAWELSVRRPPAMRLVIRSCVVLVVFWFN